MKIILTFILITLAGLIGFIIGRRTTKTFEAKLGSEMDNMRKDAHEALAERTENRKKKILEMLEQSKDKFAEGCNLREGENKKGVTSNDIENLLDVSNATANRYLDELEKEGKVRQIGTGGKNVYYILVK